MDQFLQNNRRFCKEALFHTAIDKQIAIYTSAPLDRRDIERIVKYFQLALELGIYDDDPESV
jgi:hypothetical protein